MSSKYKSKKKWIEQIAIRIIIGIILLTIFYVYIKIMITANLIIEYIFAKTLTINRHVFHITF